MAREIFENVKLDGLLDRPKPSDPLSDAFHFVEDASRMQSPFHPAPDLDDDDEDNPFSDLFTHNTSALQELCFSQPQESAPLDVPTSLSSLAAPQKLSYVPSTNASYECRDSTWSPTPALLKVTVPVRKRSRKTPLPLPSTLTKKPKLELSSSFTPCTENNATLSARLSNGEARRLQHNQMMRDNRERLSRKFAELKSVLRECESPVKCLLPMRNKMEILDRAITQYSAMRAHRAQLRASLVLGNDNDSVATSLLASARSLKSSAELLARLLMGVSAWGAAEVWMRSENRFEISSAFLSSSNNMTTAQSVRLFSARARKTGLKDPLVESAAKLGASIWVPDLRTSANFYTRTAQAEKSCISTTLYVPVVPTSETVTSAVLALYHICDDVKSGRVRVFDANEIARVDNLAGAIRNYK